jgi:hypothetical protein
MEGVFGRVEYVAVTFRIEGRETRVKEYNEADKRGTVEYKEKESTWYNETDSLASRTEPTRFAHGVNYSRSTDTQWR